MQLRFQKLTEFEGLGKDRLPLRSQRSHHAHRLKSACRCVTLLGKRTSPTRTSPSDYASR